MTKEWYQNNETGEDIICPYCGKSYEPSYEDTYISGEPVDCYEEGNEDKYICECCGKAFILSAEKKWEYTTETIEGEMTEEEWEAMNDDARF